MSDDGTSAPATRRVGPDPTKPETALAFEIRRLRAAAGLSQHQLADLIGYTRQYVSRAERLTGGCASAELVRVLDAELSAGGSLIELHAKVLPQRTARRKRAAYVEGDRSTQTLYGTSVGQATVSSSLTTQIPAAPPSVVRISALPMPGRPEPVDRQEHAVDDCVHAGGDTVGAWVGQMRPRPQTPDTGPQGHADELDRLQRIDQRVGSEHAVVGAEALLDGIGASLAESRGADRGALLRTAARAAEFAGFLYRDLGFEERCLYWHDRAMEFAQQADDGPMQAYVLLRKAQAAYDRRDAPRMLDLTLAAARFGTALGPGLRAEILQQQARGEAMLGASGDNVQRRLDEASTMLSKIGAHAADDEPGGRYSERLFGLQSALCLLDAGRPREAVLRYREVISSDLSRRDHAYFSILMATALALSGEPDEAAQLACLSLPAAIASSSRRSVREARTLADVLTPWQGRHHVQELRDVLRCVLAGQPARDE
ncbi:helix-turn-helix domain-containing protein [Pseudonocardia sichuanensis]|uniref:Helix-turn-helix protein n=1 Tax=Pseudonocardia kunmingensis TaxID=630975 RepID=A0A543D9K4_9PSEU|nr:helix-turn-helix transcriptional regulator [Pseudonocardia kunmingensis]TQM06024.1 helix-turn-helix protein [Pseudonocardia kunmingensis]